MNLTWTTKGSTRKACSNGLHYEITPAGKRNFYNLFVNGNYFSTLEGIDNAKARCEQALARFNDLGG